MDYWITSDHHFYHKNIIRLSKRPFADVKEMADTLIQRWNDKVKPEDTVYYLGDFGFLSGSSLLELGAMLNGRKLLIQGNHDNWSVNKMNEVFIGCSPYLRIGQVLLTHKPDYKQNFGNYALNLHGHKHPINQEDAAAAYIYKEGRSYYNVGVDYHNYYPIELDHLIQDFV